MSGEFIFEAESRTEAGKGGARRLRRASKVPAVLYGGHGEPELLQFDHNSVLKQLENEAVYSHVLTIRVGGREESAILKALQRHPSRPIIAHMDFQRVSATDRIRVHVPLHFINETTCVGVKKGGVVMHGMVEVEVVCLPGQLPEYIEVDLAQIDLGQTVHLTDLSVPAGVQIHSLMQGVEHNLPVAVVQKMGAGAEGAE